MFKRERTSITRLFNFGTSGGGERRRHLHTLYLQYHGNVVFNFVTQFPTELYTKVKIE